MSAAILDDSLALAQDDPRKVSASEVKQKGLPGLVERLSMSGMAVLTDHKRIQGVLLSPERYAALSKAASAYHDEALRQAERDYEARIAYLRSPEGTEALRSLTCDVSDLDEGIVLGASL